MKMIEFKVKCEADLKGGLGMETLFRGMLENTKQTNIEALVPSRLSGIQEIHGDDCISNKEVIIVGCRGDPYKITYVRIKNKKNR